MNLFRLSISYVRRRRLDTLLNVVLLGLGIGTIVVLLLVGRQFRANLTRDAAGIDAVVGAKGSPIQLILSSVFHLDVPTGNIPLRDAQMLMRHPMVEQAIPLALGDSYHAYPIVGTNHDYIALRGAEPASGKLWEAPFEVVVGARVAREGSIAVGDELISTHGLIDHGDEHADQPLRVVGVLRPTGGVLDRVLLTDVETVWAVHAEEGEVPRELTALLIRYKAPAAAVMFPGFVNAQTKLQAASPAFETVRLFSLLGVGFDAMRAFGILLVLTAALSIFVSLYNAMRARRYDLAVMRTLGATRGTLLRHVLLEGTLLASAGTAFGLALGHLATEILGLWSVAERQMAFTGRMWVVSELWLVALAVAVGVVSAVLPAVQAYRVDIARTLARR